jgi:hypothetical protein
MPALARSREVPPSVDERCQTVELYVRGELPKALSGHLVIAMSRRHKRRSAFFRWQDSQADLLRLDLRPGKPSRVEGHVLAVDPSGQDVGDGFNSTAFDRASYGRLPAYGFATQPNHGLNFAAGKVWTTNLLFGAPLQMDISRWQPERVLRYVEPDATAPRVSSTSHFAWSKDGQYAYFHQSLLAVETAEHPVQTRDLKLVRLDVRTGAERVWELIAPPDDSRAEAWNFHSAFYWEEGSRRFVGLLRTGAVVQHVSPHTDGAEHAVVQMPVSTIWMVEVDEFKPALQASLLPGIAELGGLALSHLDVDVSAPDGFILYANFKEAAVGEETHGVNFYGQNPEDVAEHYSGMIVEPLNIGKVMRYEHRPGQPPDITVFEQPYHFGRSSIGHTWLPINIELDASRRSLYCTFNGFHPRLLPRHIAAAYPGRTIDAGQIRPVPSLMMRLDAQTLRPEYDNKRTYLSYGEPVAMAVVGSRDTGYVCTFSPEEGLKVYRAGDFNELVCHAISHELLHWEDTHFRPDPAHMIFVPWQE